MDQAETPTVSGDSENGKRKIPTGKLYAIADIHLSYQGNREAWAELTPHPGAGLMIVGDVGETIEHVELAFSTATKRFDAVWWCPGNHELYTLPAGSSRGEHKYDECVELARKFGVLTPEDDFVVWDGEGGSAVIAPIFTLYDYSFKPDDVPLKDAVEWAKEENIEATDQYLLHPDPFNSREEWCHSLVRRFEAKLEAAKAKHPSLPFVLANHWPLRKDLVNLKFIPRFVIWCGTTLTDDWHQRFNAKVVISGHLHIRRTDWKHGCRFEEASLGYPRQWKHRAEIGMDVNDHMVEVLPGPEPPVGGEAPTKWGHFGHRPNRSPRN